MTVQEALDNEQALLETSKPEWGLTVPGATPVQMQKLDLARHSVKAPGESKFSHYVVATFDDRGLGRGFVTAIYPQQGGYLTMYRLQVAELHSETQEEAVQNHRRCIEMIQQGKLKQFLASLTNA
ncbi:hypothetical protein EI42_05777 [Thermosporothrix hazakensis]|jgi:hypothetical protein|uniref:Uncharacterized protein n=2 Tax=Thermosporothrix TaxID=768650 RepID=A0A326TVY3_THEHA|nr:hypothetical protein [Thermosporothrix hazakensis]PZW21015.1 hypothetical protein EI42_05777 [Thermosporothrix hazakensis]BBH91153.1 hypothetical protein KTC_59040 [Thermosporothrix sp. COM3]GCE49298.1 hypothetical protein KTH_41670 [Thermosporothrix hazakensis]